jgi:hypothetical protein
METGVLQMNSLNKTRKKYALYGMTNIQKKGREFMKSLVQKRPAFLSGKKKKENRDHDLCKCHHLINC